MYMLVHSCLSFFILLEFLSESWLPPDISITVSKERKESMPVLNETYIISPTFEHIQEYVTIITARYFIGENTLRTKFLSVPKSFSYLHKNPDNSYSEEKRNLNHLLAVH